MSIAPRSHTQLTDGPIRQMFTVLAAVRRGKPHNTTHITKGTTHIKVNCSFKFRFKELKQMSFHLKPVGEGEGERLIGCAARWSLLRE